MAKTDFIPDADTEYGNWLVNLRDKIAIHGPTLNLLPAEIGTIQADCQQGIDDVTGTLQKKNELKATVATKKNNRKIFEPGIRKKADRWKTETTFTEGIGYDLGIIGLEAGEKPNKPLLKLKMEGMTVEIKFNLYRWTGVKIFSKRTGDSEYTFLAVDTDSPYHDTRANKTPGTPETRWYKAVFLDDDDEVGEESDEVSIAVK
jgi:hypothetical protein